MRAISYILLIIGTYYAGARTAQLLCETRYVIFCPAEMQLPESVIADYPHNRRTLGKPVQHVSPDGTSPDLVLPQFQDRATARRSAESW
jgi:hypothetical protein